MFCFLVLRGGGAFGDRGREGQVVEIQGKEGERRGREGEGHDGELVDMWAVECSVNDEGGREGRRRIGGCKEAAAGRAREMRGAGGRRGEMGMALARRGGGV